MSALPTGVPPENEPDLIEASLSQRDKQQMSEAAEAIVANIDNPAILPTEQAIYPLQPPHPAETESL